LGAFVFLQDVQSSSRDTYEPPSSLVEPPGYTEIDPHQTVPMPGQGYQQFGQFYQGQGYLQHESWQPPPYDLNKSITIKFGEYSNST